MEDTAERQLRAYVFGGNARMIDVEAGKQPSVKLRLFNLGQTPAYEVTAGVSIGFGSYPVFGLFPEAPQAPVHSRATIGPGRQVRHAVTKAEPLTFEEVVAIHSGTGAIYVVGEIRYVDAFKKPRRTQFRLMYSAGAVKRGDNRLDVCEGGNEAT
jgi:hypothetical protein